MERRKKANCCLEETGKKLPFHLCCAACRKKQARQERLRLISEGTAPRECGPEVVAVAPARGPVRLHRPTRMLPDGKGGWKVVDMGYRDRAAMVQCDVFDVMTAQAKRRGGRPPFTAIEIDTARIYRAVYEHCQGVGYNCSRAFDLDQIRGGGDGAYIEAVMRDIERLRRFHRAIGTEAGLSVRRVRPSQRGGRQSIPDRALVDMVCIEDKPLNAVLKAFGWYLSGKNRKALKAAFCAVLARMEGI